jgi:hypothetical protein
MVMQNTGSWLLFALVISAATAMLAYMLWQVGTHRAIERGRVRSAVVQLILSVAIGIAAAAVGRVLLGAPVGDLPPLGERPIRLHLRPLDRQQTVILTAAVAVMLACFLWALRVVNAIVHAPPPPEPPNSESQDV